MLKGLYTAASGMLSNMIATDTMANNLANVNTLGFKKSEVHFQTFPEMLIQRMSPEGNKFIGSLPTGSTIAGTTINFSQGSMRDTGNPLDMALQGDGFFSVKNGRGETLYTRNGNFTVSQDGFLVTQTGERVQGEGGDIQIPGGVNISVTQFGQIEGDTLPLGKLKVTRFQNNNVLSKVGDSLFQVTPGVKPNILPVNPNNPGYEIQQYKVETSNTNVVGEMLNSILGLRLYESLQKNIKVQNDTLGRVVNDVGKTV